MLYIKGSESIEDTLTFIGAQQCTLDLMNVAEYLYKDVRNKARSHQPTATPRIYR